MPYVNLPPGCRSLQMEDGRRYVAARTGGRVEVSSEHAAAIDRMSGNGTAGLLTAQFREFSDSRRRGRVCTRCGFRAYAWSMTCPRSSCGAATEPE
jgi:hypothetical protein